MRLGCKSRSSEEGLEAAAEGETSLEAGQHSELVDEDRPVGEAAGGPQAPGGQAAMGLEDGFELLVERFRISRAELGEDARLGARGSAAASRVRSGVTAAQQSLDAAPRATG